MRHPQEAALKKITTTVLSLILGILAPLPLAAIGPMDYYNGLVAGGDETGYQDGPFYQALFNLPAGIAFDDSGENLFVADEYNYRIRVIHLNDHNRVETLAGTGASGKGDGTFSQASFNLPMLLARLPNNHLAVYDTGDALLRILDLAKKTVTTMGNGPIGPAWSIAYRPADDSLYFSDPWNGRLEKFDFKTQAVSMIFSGNPLLPKPKALCIDSGRLFLADQDLPTVYEVDFLANSANAQAPVSLKEAGKGDHILEMTVSDGALYALQSTNIPLARVNPPEPVHLATPWGFFMDYDNPGYAPFLKIAPGQPLGFAANPLEPRKLLVSFPNESSHSVVSVTDYDYDKYWISSTSANEDDPLPDFRYPKAKPPHIFRILVAGNSRVVCASTIVPGVKPDDPTFDKMAQFQKSHHVFTFPKQLEFLLNTEAALEGIDTRFEVLVLGRPARGTPFFGYWEIPELIQKYDIDLAFAFANPQELDPFYLYYERPVSPEGVPQHDPDYEYLLKPMESRIPPGAPREFYEHCKKLNLVEENPKNQFNFKIFSELLKKGDQGVWDGLIELLGKPYRLMAAKIKTLKNTQGANPRFFICYCPNGDQGMASLADHHRFWKILCERDQLTMLDLSDPFNALQKSFYPTNDECCHSHYTAHGHSLIALLLKRELTSRKWIPLETGPK